MNRSVAPVDPTLVAALDQFLVNTNLRQLIAEYAREDYAVLVMNWAEKKDPAVYKRYWLQLAFWATHFHSEEMVLNYAIQHMVHDRIGPGDCSALVLWVTAELAVCPWFKPVLRLYDNEFQILHKGPNGQFIPNLLKECGFNIDQAVPDDEGNCEVGVFLIPPSVYLLQHNVNKQGERMRLCGIYFSFEAILKGNRFLLDCRPSDTDRIDDSSRP